MKIYEQIHDDDCGDFGLVTCGKCGKILQRWEAYLHTDYVYLCDVCDLDEFYRIKEDFQ